TLDDIDRSGHRESGERIERRVGHGRLQYRRSPLRPAAGAKPLPFGREGARVLLAIDVGNTNIVLGVFAGDELLASWRLTTHPLRTADEYAALLQTLLGQLELTLRRIGGVSLASTVPPPASNFRELSERYLHVPTVVASPRIETGIRIAVDNPHEV